MKCNAYYVLSGEGGVNKAVNTVNSVLIMHGSNEYPEQQRALSPCAPSIWDAGKVAFVMLVLRHLLCMFGLGHSVLGFKKLTA